MDIPIQDIFGHKTPDLIRFGGRRVKSSHPTIVNKFNTQYKRFVIKNRLAHKIFLLQRNTTFPIRHWQKQAAKDIARLRAEGIQYANKRCRRLFRGEIKFTPEISIYGTRLETCSEEEGRKKRRVETTCTHVEKSTNQD